MHVLQLVPTLTIGGVERGVLDFTKGLVARGHRVTVISAGGPLVERVCALGATHHQLPVDQKSLVTMWSCVPSVVQIIQEEGIDLVHARSRIPGWIGWVAARRTQRPFLTTAHGFYRPHLFSRVMVWGRCVIAPSEALGRYLREQFGLSGDRLRVIPRGVDLDEFMFQPVFATHTGPWRIGMVGRFSPLKGHEVALRACDLLARQGVAVKLCFAGAAPTGVMRRRIEGIIRSRGLASLIEWQGRQDDIPRFIASMDLIIVPSIYPESFGRSVIEAYAVGRPVVASQIGALPELIEDGRTGLLVPPGHAEALSGAIKRLLEDPRLRSQCVAEARACVERQWDAQQMVERTLAVYEECLTRPRVLIWKLGAIGDVVLASPSFRAIRRQFPQSHITLVTGRRAYELVARCPYVNDIIVYEAKGKDRGFWRLMAFVRRVRAVHAAISIDVQNSRSTHLLAWLAGIPVRIGYRRKWGWLLNHGVRLPKVVLAPIAHQHYLLRTAGLSTDGEALEVWSSARDEQRVERLIPRDPSGVARPLVGLHPGGSGRWKTKRWEVSRWAKLCDVLMQREIDVVFTGSPEERALGEAILQRTSSRPFVAIGETTLLELAALIKRCAVFVVPDSAALHLAAAVGTPTVALFGPTDPQRHVPPTFRGEVIKKPVFCSPCYSTSCRTITHACMQQISVEDVLRVILGFVWEA